ncbi:hypothetical protein [Vreelandella sulfidaeris]|uniref:hypothetical protein n=1 Tax=Vreelandella sulfidaeris TaxID=115553 RepID=UPI0035E631F5|tara:strand:+ start:907 stop:1167 length:261 start_codon:yes stop_codon:yes gene_type:complete
MRPSPDLTTSKKFGLLTLELIGGELQHIAILLDGTLQGFIEAILIWLLHAQPHFWPPRLQEQFFSICLSTRAFINLYAACPAGTKR